MSTIGHLNNRHDLAGRLPHGGVVAEIGVRDGDFADVIWRRNWPRELHLVDVWCRTPDTDDYHDHVCNAPEQRHRDAAARVRDRFDAYTSTPDGMKNANGSIVLHQRPGVEYLATVPDGFFDWIYFDARHDYGSVTVELAAAASKVKPGGYIAGHDYTDAPAAIARGVAVKRAVDEFVADGEWKIVYLTHDDPPTAPSYAMRRA